MKANAPHLALTPGPDDGELDLPDALGQLTFAVQGVLGRIAAAHALSIVQVRLLAVVGDGRPTISELARLLQLDKTSVTGLVDRAAQRGLVVRAPSSRDGRSVLVVITAAGQAVMAQVAAAFDDAIGALVTDLSGKQRRRLAHTASLVVAADTRRRGISTGA